MRHAACLFLVVFCFASLAEDTYEYGTPAELNGLTTYFLDTGTDVEMRNRIAAEVARETTALTIADSSDHARMQVRVMGNDTSEQGASFLLYVTGQEGHARLIHRFEYTHSKLPRLRPSARFARDFTKLWREAQSE